MNPDTSKGMREELLQRLLENFPNGSVNVFDKDLRYVLVEGKGLEDVGLSSEHLVGKTLADVFEQEQVEYVKPFYLRAFGGENVEFELPLGDHCYSINVSPLRDDESNIHLIIAVAQEITERKRLEHELRQRATMLAEADRRKDEFLALLSHELRNPLASIRNALHILGQADASATDMASVRKIMERQVENLTRLVDDLLEVSRITSGKIRLRRKPVDLAEIVARVVESARPLIEAQAHDLRVSLPDEAVRVEADPTRLEQILSNLVNNAAKYTERNGRIWISVEREGADALISVRDTGVGIADDLMPHVFDLFTQADRSLDRSQGGLGIGLALVRSLVELHGGTVTAASAGPGRGSEFIVRIPALDRAGAVDEDKPEDGILFSGVSNGLRVLVVDDNHDSAESIALLMRMWKHDVEVAHDGPSAVRAAQSYLPDVMLLDIGLPGLDGYEVAQQVRRAPELNNIVLVAMTGYGQEEDRRRSREAGFNQHLVKPVNPVMLEQLLRSLAAKP